jgi:hypothetical protein
MKPTKALRYLQHGQPLHRGYRLPGGAVEMAAQRQADIIATPGRFIFNCLSQEYGINQERTVMAGACLHTDSLLGTTCGLKTTLTLTGVSTPGDVKSNQESDCMSNKKMVPCLPCKVKELVSLISGIKIIIIKKKRIIGFLLLISLIYDLNYIAKTLRIFCFCMFWVYFPLPFL